MQQISARSHEEWRQKRGQEAGISDGAVFCAWRCLFRWSGLSQLLFALECSAARYWLENIVQFFVVRAKPKCFFFFLPALEGIELIYRS